MTSDKDKIVRINGVEVPPEKRGRKIKLYNLMSMHDIEAMLLAGKEAGKSRAVSARDKLLQKENKNKVHGNEK